MSRSSLLRSCHRERERERERETRRERAIINLVLFISIILHINSRNFRPYLILCFCYYKRQNSGYQFCGLIIFPVYALPLILKYWVDLTQELTNQKGLATSLKNLSVGAFIRQVDTQNKAISETEESRQKSKEQLGRRIGI